METNKKLKIAITVEIVLVLIIIISLIDFNAECSMIECLGKIIPFIALIITTPLAIIDLFIIQIFREKSLLTPSLISFVLLIIIFSPSILGFIDASKPENSLKDIVNNDNAETDKYIEYIIYNNHIYYYKYNTNDYLSYGILFMSDLKGENAQKKCKLKYGTSIRLSFIYENKIYYKFDSYDEDDDLSGLKRLNLNNCKEETIIEDTIEDKDFNEFNFLLNTRNKNTILISQEYSIYDEEKELYKELYKEYTYDIDTNEIIENNIDDYYPSDEEIIYNNQLINSSKGKKLLA